jgi:hypothetical protein
LNRKLVSTPKVSRVPDYVVSVPLDCCGASSFRRVLSTNSFGAHRGSSQHIAWHRRRDPTEDTQALVVVPRHDLTSEEGVEVDDVANIMDSSKSSSNAWESKRKTLQHMELLKPGWPKWQQERDKLLERHSHQHPRCRQDRRAKRSKGPISKP